MVISVTMMCGEEQILRPAHGFQLLQDLPAAAPDVVQGAHLHLAHRVGRSPWLYFFRSMLMISAAGLELIFDEAASISEPNC